MAFKPFPPKTPGKEAPGKAPPFGKAPPAKGGGKPFPPKKK